MRLLFIFASCLFAPNVLGAVHEKISDDELYSLPEGFLLGAGLSACQAEGAWNEGGKAESILDRVTHLYPTVFHDNANVAADHYHRYKEDLSFVKEMNFTSHRFSISWSRVLPTGDAKNRNEEGIKFYHDYIDELVRLGIEPMVTMMHFDFPWSLQDSHGGYLNPVFTDLFRDYAELLFQEYGSKVKYWNTINEPNMFCNYISTILNAARINDNDYNGWYSCMHNMIMAHAKTYRLYKDKYYKTQKGFVGFSVLVWAAVPATTSAEDVVATEIFNQLMTGTTLHPLVYGDYPPTTRYLVDKRSEQLGLNESRLPHFSPEEKELLSGVATDFLAVNVYNEFNVSYRLSDSTSSCPSCPTLSDNNQSMPPLLGLITEDMPMVSVENAPFSTQIDPALLHNTIMWAWNTYHVPIIIAENGYADQEHVGVQDYTRVAYHSANLRSLLRTMKKFDIEVWGYYVWSLLDVWEFTAGYDQRPFGLIHIDYKSGSLNRTMKESAKFFTKLMKTRIVPDVPPPSSSASSASSATAVTLAVILAVCGLLTFKRGI